MAIGQDLLDVPFADLVHSLALAIAEGQLELDRSAIRTLQFLIDPNNSIDLVTEIIDVITPVSGAATVPGTGQVIPYTSAQVTSSGAAPVKMTLFQAGLTPTFYQFTDASIEVKISITVRQESQAASSGEGRLQPPLRIHASPVDYRTSNTYSYAAQGSSVLKATLKPVPPPPRLTPRTVTVDAIAQPPRVTIVG
jgi:hypothetical protein